MLRRLGVSERAAGRRSDLTNNAWAKSGLLVWKDPAVVGPKANPSRRLLDRFVALADANGEAYKDFASSFGPLYLCRHGQPMGHRVLLSDRTLSKGLPEDDAEDADRAYLAEEWDRRVVNWPCAEVHRPEDHPLVEGLTDWRRISQQAAAMQRIIRHLNSGRPAPAVYWTSFQAVMEEPVQAWLPDPDDPVGGRTAMEWAALPVAQGRSLAVNQQRRLMAFFIDDWLRQSLMRPRFHWEPSRTGLEPMGQGSLFAAIVLELAQDASAGRKVLCANCGKDFVATRKPALGRNTYCTRSACKEARKRVSRSRISSQTASK